MTRLTQNSIQSGMDWLIQQEPRFQIVLTDLGYPTFRSKPDGFVGLMQSIVSQQLSTKAAKTIWHRLVDAGLTDPSVIIKSPDDHLRQAGLSKQKIRYVRALAKAPIDYASLKHQSTPEVIDALIPVLGIGRWTAQMYALFALQHTDVFAPHDLGLQEGMRKLFMLPHRPSEKEADQMASHWSPWRSVASLALWAYHEHVS